MRDFKEFGVQPITFGIGFISGWIADFQPAFTFIVVDVEIYRGGRAVEA